MRHAVAHRYPLQLRPKLNPVLGLIAVTAFVFVVTGCDGGSTQSLEDDPIASPASQKKTTTENRSSTAFESVESVKELLAYEAGFDRSLALHQLLANVDERQLIDLLQQSREIDVYSQRRETQNAIFQKLASLNPKAAMAQAVAMSQFERDALIATIFSQWSLDDLDTSIEHVKSLPGFQKRAALRGILQSRDDLAEDVRREIAREVGMEQLAVDLIAQSELARSLKSPEQAWSDLVNDEVGNAAQTGLLIQVAEAWFDTSGLSVLSEINQSLVDRQTRQSVLHAIVQRLVQSNPQEAFDYATNMGDEGDSLLIALARAWSSLDPESALSAALTVESDRLRRNLEHVIAQSWASSDPHFILSNLDRLPASSQAVAQSEAIIAIARTSPEEAAQLMAGMDDPTSQYSVAYAIVFNWVRTDIAGALDWVLNTDKLKNLQEHLLPVVLNSLARENPELAMQTALDQPIGSYGSGMEVRVLSYIASVDPQKALELLPRVREGQSHLFAHISVGGALARAGQAESAFELAASLQESQRERYYGNLIGTWAANDTEGLYENLDKFPTAQTRSSAALELLTWNGWQKSLSSEQIDRAKSFLTQKDAETLEKGEASKTFGFRRGVERGLMLQGE
ncbi:MAG: hypothetical protein OXG24_09350 [Gammaproteobacteria bacterium]|nr:hypothetical protein [Gammaproteobacteria bacterium]